MIDLLPTLITSFVGGGAFVGTLRFLRFLIERRDRKHLHSVEENIKATSRIYDEMQYLMEKTPCDRVLIIEAHNSGRIPRPGIKLYATIIHEVHGTSIKSCRRGWPENSSLDSSYVKMLAELVEKGHLEIYTDDMSDSALHNTYRSIGVSCSHVDMLAASEGSLFYTSISFAEDPCLSPTDREYIRGSLGRIKELFLEYHFLKDE